MNSHDQSQPFDDDLADDDFDDDEEPPRLSLKAAMVWVATRNPDVTHAVETDEWNAQLDEWVFEFAANAAGAWEQWLSLLIIGKMTAFGIPYVIPSEFDISVDRFP
jgi:hypothetical protein